MIRFLPFFLMGAPLALAVIDLIRTPRAHASNQHSTMSNVTR